MEIFRQLPNPVGLCRLGHQLGHDRAVRPWQHNQSCLTDGKMDVQSRALTPNGCPEIGDACCDADEDRAPLGKEHFGMSSKTKSISITLADKVKTQEPSQYNLAQTNSPGRPRQERKSGLLVMCGRGGTLHRESPYAGPRAGEEREKGGDRTGPRSSLECAASHREGVETRRTN